MQSHFKKYFFFVVLFQTVQTQLNESREQLLNDSRIGSNTIMRKLYELDQNEEPELNNVKLMTCSQFWGYRQTVSLEAFRYVVRENFATSQGQDLKLLSYFLENVSSS